MSSNQSAVNRLFTVLLIAVAIIAAGYAIRHTFSCFLLAFVILAGALVATSSEHSKAKGVSSDSKIEAKKAAEAHGGRTWVVSDEASGTTFFLALPRATRR